MNQRTSQFLCDSTRGSLVQGEHSSFETVSIDTRTLDSGAAFFCLKGPNFDGHRFARDARARGASIIVVERAALPTLGDLEGLGTVVAVDDTERALAELSAAWRDLHDVTIIGLTGSSGKTTTKELIAAVLSSAGPTLATHGNLNNHLGVPLTLLRLTSEHRYAVIEMGMNALGEIAYLASLAKPSIGVVTTVGQAHTEGVGSLDGVAQAKGELLTALPSDGLGLIPSAIDRRARLTTGLRAPLVTVGDGPEAAVRLIRYADTAHGAEAEIMVDGVTASMKIELTGRHSVDNAMLAVAVGRALGVPMSDALTHLAQVNPPRLRGEVRHLADSTEVVLDCYNANPQSMRAAVGTFLERHPDGVLALGDMLELGTTAADEHTDLGRYVAALDGRPELVGVGQLSQYTVEGARAAGMDETRTAWFADAVEATSEVASRCAGRALLLKGSRGMRMERIFDTLSARRGQ